MLQIRAAPNLHRTARKSQHYSTFLPQITISHWLYFGFEDGLRLFAFGSIFAVVTVVIVAVVIVVVVIVAVVIVVVVDEISI